MTDRVWNAGVNQTLTQIVAKINQSESLAGKTSQWLTINQSKSLAGKTSQWLSVSGMNQTPTLTEAKINQSESLAEKPANDWPCLGCRRQ
jgi:hypothetical protein